MYSLFLAARGAEPGVNTARQSLEEVPTHAPARQILFINFYRIHALNLRERAKAVYMTCVMWPTA